MVAVVVHKMKCFNMSSNSDYDVHICIPAMSMLTTLWFRCNSLCQTVETSDSLLASFDHMAFGICSDVTCAQETTCILPPCMCRTKPLYGESDGMRTSAALMAFSPLSLNAMMYVRFRSIGSDFGCGRRSNTSTSRPRLASSIAAHEPAGPAPTTTTFCLQAFANCSTECSNVKGR